MSNILKRHSSNPTIITFPHPQSYRVTTNQSRLSEINKNQNLYSPPKQRYYPDYYVGYKNVQRIKYDKNVKRTYYDNTPSQSIKNKPFPNNQSQNFNNQYQNQTQFSHYPTFLKQNIIQVKNNQNLLNYQHQKTNSIKPKLTHNVYLTKQNSQQRKNYILPTPKNFYNIDKDKTFIMQFQQFTTNSDYQNKSQHYQNKMSYQNKNYQQLSYTNDSQLEQTEQCRQYNQMNFQQDKNKKRFQFANNILDSFTFKNKQLKDSQLSQKQIQTKHQSKVSSQQSYAIECLSNPNKFGLLQSPRQSQKSTHLLFQLKQSIHDSTSDSGAVIPSQEQTKTLKQIQQLQKLNQMIEKENNKIEKQIEQKIQYERQLLTKMNKLMKLFQNLKNKQMSKIKENKNIQEEKHQSKLSQLQIHSVYSNKNTQMPKNKSHILPNNKRQSHLSTKGSFSHTNHLQKQFSIENKRYNHIYNEQIKVQSPKKLRLNVVNDTILQYSPIDSSLFSSQKPTLFNFHSNSTLKDEIFQTDMKDKRQSPIKSRNNLIDVSMSGFQSRFVPRQNTQTKLKELQEIFQKEIKKCYSPKHEQSRKSISQKINQDKREKKQKLKRLSQQIKQLRIVVEKQNSTPNLAMLIFSNSSLT